nr:MAG TPA: hypothetical protein [Caudoviricetes sp.]
MWKTCGCVEHISNGFVGNGLDRSPQRKTAGPP